MDSNDSRCCGTGTCMINLEGVCWCGQRWDGEKMCAPAPLAEPDAALKDANSQRPPAADAPHQP